MVPLIDLSRRMTMHLEHLQAAVARVASSGAVLLGPETVAFESEFSAWAGAAHGVAVSSGASAIQLALAALGVGVGDEVIVPAMTAVPTASSVAAVGAIPVFVDVDQHTAAIDIDAVRSALSERTRAIIAVHLYGRPVEHLDELGSLGVPLIEDCAQSHGATRGLSGAIACYSFYPTKNLGGIGDGGMVVTDDGDLADRVARLRAHGQVEQYVHAEVSQNHRMSEIESAWLRITLPELNAGNARRREIVRRYREAAPHLTWHADHPDHVFHLAVARVSDRERFRTHLSASGVSTGVHYPLALTQQPALRGFVTERCPRAEAWAAQCVSVPCFPELTDDEVSTVCRALAEADA